MAQYNRWMNRNLYDASGTLSEAQVFEDRGAFFGSLFGTLNHIAVADTIWLRRFAQLPELVWLEREFAGVAGPPSLSHRLAESLSGLRSYRERLDTLIDRFSGTVTQNQLASTLRYADMAGKSQARVTDRPNRAIPGSP